jgi:hypothetical protein
MRAGAHSHYEWGKSRRPAPRLVAEVAEVAEKFLFQLPCIDGATHATQISRPVQQLQTGASAVAGRRSLVLSRID